MSRVKIPKAENQFYHKGLTRNYNKDYWFLDDDVEQSCIKQDRLTRREANRPVWELMFDADETPMEIGYLMNQQEVRWMLRYKTLCIGTILKKIRNGDGFWICFEKKLNRKGESIYKLRRLTNGECERLGY